MKNFYSYSRFTKSYKPLPNKEIHKVHKGKEHESKYFSIFHLESSVEKGCIKFTILYIKNLMTLKRYEFS